MVEREEGIVTSSLGKEVREGSQERRHRVKWRGNLSEDTEAGSYVANAQSKSIQFCCGVGTGRRKVQGKARKGGRGVG